MSGRIYRSYVLGLLMVIYAFNFLDRQVITILAPSLKAALTLTDAQIGLLFGTAFALFYALFGIPLAKLADGWNRVKTIGLGLTIWSGMTALSAFAGNFVQLGLARVGVGIGEASGSPAAYSLLADYYPKEKRGTALSLYSSGIYLGVGASLMFGGAVVAYWAWAFTPETQPLGLAGWQATFLAFGLPGLVLALLLVLTVREPVRGASEGLVSGGEARPFAAMAREFGAMFPPFSMIGLARARAKTALGLNLALFLGCLAAAAVAIGWTNSMLPTAKLASIGEIGGLTITTNVVQWVAVAIGAYCSFSWFQALRLRDRPSAALIGNGTFTALSLAGGLMSFASYGISPFIFQYAQATFHVGPEAGFALGLILAVSGALGTTAGGMVGDWARRRSAAGRIYVVLFASLSGSAALAWTMSASSLPGYYLGLGLTSFLGIMWLGPVAASTQDLVLPRMRGAGTAVFFLGTNIIGLGLGPYVVGLISDATGDLRFAMLSVLFALPVTVGLLVYAARTIPRREESRIERARAAGEPV